MKGRFMVRNVTHSAEVKIPIDILYLSDLHFNGWSGLRANSLCEYVFRNPPDLILLGGDYLDTRGGASHFERLLKTCSATCPTFAIGGNHDRFYGIVRIKALLDRHRVDWIQQRSLTLTINENLIRMHGGYVPENDTPSDGLSLVVLHEPVNFDHLCSKCHLAFAGHLHGCQFVFWQRGFDLYPGRLFYRNNFLERRDKDLAYFISRGLGDTLPLRVSCPREVVRVRVEAGDKTSL